MALSVWYLKTSLTASLSRTHHQVCQKKQQSLLLQFQVGTIFFFNKLHPVNMSPYSYWLEAQSDQGKH